MEKFRFDNDYMRGAHPEILNSLVSTNMMQTPGYGLDEESERARRVIRRHCGLEDAEVQFLIGGTQANATVIDALLRPYQGILCTDQAHINVHESGAIEASGHKVLPIVAPDGKLTAGMVESWLADFYADDTWTHKVIPGMVYISQPTELGTMYSLEELTALSETCRRAGLSLYVDGARLLYALAADCNDVSLKDMARLCDAFYIGGTKAGALFGEAVVIPDRRLVPEFFTMVKRHGALLAKGRIAALQFAAMFAGDLWQRLGRAGIDAAMRLRKGMLERGFTLLFDSPTNQQFFVIPNAELDRISAFATFSLWGPRGESESAVRFVTDWSTTPEEVDAFLSRL